MLDSFYAAFVEELEKIGGGSSVFKPIRRRPPSSRSSSPGFKEWVERYKRTGKKKPSGQLPTVPTGTRESQRMPVPGSSKPPPKPRVVSGEKPPVSSRQSLSWLGIPNKPKKIREK